MLSMRYGENGFLKAPRHAGRRSGWQPLWFPDAAADRFDGGYAHRSGTRLTTSAPRAPVNYSEGMIVGDFIFASGLMASDYKTGVPIEARVDPAFLLWV
jgi:hypothetical protein